MAIAFEGASWTSEYAFPMMLMQTMLGSWDRANPAGRNMASRLSRVLAEQDLVHSYSSFNTCYKVCTRDHERVATRKGQGRNSVHRITDLF